MNGAIENDRRALIEMRRSGLHGEEHRCQVRSDDLVESGLRCLAHGRRTTDTSVREHDIDFAKFLCRRRLIETRLHAKVLSTQHVYALFLGAYGPAFEYRGFWQTHAHCERQSLRLQSAILYRVQQPVILALGRKPGCCTSVLGACEFTSGSRAGGLGSNDQGTGDGAHRVVARERLGVSAPWRNQTAGVGREREPVSGDVQPARPGVPEMKRVFGLPPKTLLSRGRSQIVV